MSLAAAIVYKSGAASSSGDLSEHLEAAAFPFCHDSLNFSWRLAWWMRQSYWGEIIQHNHYMHVAGAL